jgi:hypothetical protein
MRKVKRIQASSSQNVDSIINPPLQQADPKSITDEVVKIIEQVRESNFEPGTFIVLTRNRENEKEEIKKKVIPELKPLVTGFSKEKPEKEKKKKKKKSSKSESKKTPDLRSASRKSRSSDLLKTPNTKEGVKRKRTPKPKKSRKTRVSKKAKK